MPEPLVWDERCRDLFDHVKQAIPLRCRIAGDSVVMSAVCLAVQDWPSAELSESFGDSRKSEFLVDTTARWVTRTIRDTDKNVGSLAAIVLPMLVSAIVEVILKWWLSNKQNQRSVSRIQSSVGKRKK